MRVWCEFDPWVGKIPWRRKWQPTPVFLPGESHRQRSLGVYSPRSWKNLTWLKQLSMHTLVHCGTLGRWLNLSEPQFLHPQNSDNTSLLRIKWNHVYKGLVHSTCSIIGACYWTIMPPNGTCHTSPTRTVIIIHAFSNYLLSAYYVPDIVLGNLWHSNDWNQPNPALTGTFALVETNKKQSWFVTSDVN